MVPVISAAKDPQRTGADPVWHILEPDGKPFCHARISGNVITSKKGTPTCNRCKSYDYPKVYEKSQALLLRLDAGEVIKAMPKRQESYEVYTLEDHRLVTIDQANYVVLLTERGRIATMDLKAPALWRDGFGIIHGRRPLNDDCYCDKRIGMTYCADLAVLHEKAKRLRLTKITCMECIVRQAKYDAVAT